MRVCCDCKSIYKVTYDGGQYFPNDVILVCDLHICKSPYNQKIIKQELIED